jgi:predicted protein tyrosine phosphatase
MPKTINLPRLSAQKFSGDLTGDTESWPQSSIAWVSIGEPEDGDSIICNGWLDRTPNLKLQFWDTTTVVTDLFGETFEPPTKSDAAQIVDFLVKNKTRNIVVNCAAGISRSGAVCAFLEKHLGYQWLEEGKTRTYKKHGPNKLLLRMMEEYYYE